MRKFTLFAVALATASALNAQDYVWKGKQADQIWSTAVANWQSGSIPVPKTWADNAKAIFDDTSATGSDTITVNGTILTSGISINATRPYVLRKTADTDVLSGTGSLIKEGIGDFSMDIKNSLTDGTIVREGRLIMEKQTSPNIFGSKIVMEGGTVNFASTNSSAYPAVSVPMEIPAGKSAIVELSRYSYWSSKLSGSGNLTVKVGGDRTYLGAAKFSPVDWSEFTGNVKVEQNVISGVTPGFYGLMLNTGKTFDMETITGIDSTLYDKKLSLGSGTVLTSESGTRCYAIGELTAADETSQIIGYYKKSDSPKIYYMIGGLNTDVVFPGVFADYGGKGYNYVGLVKVGTGTYTFTSNNTISGVTGVTVKEGRFYFNTVDEPLKTSLGRCKQIILNIKKDAIGGGNGRITGAVEVSGKLEIGYHGIGTIIVADTLSTDGVTIGKDYNFPVNFRSTGEAEFEIASANSYDKLIENDQIRFYTDTIEGQVYMPVIKVIPAASFDVKDGDIFTLMTWKEAKGVNDAYKVEFGDFKGVTWTYEEVEEKDTEGNVTGYKLVATAKGSGIGTGIKNTNAAEGLKIYPNPSNGEFNVAVEGAEINKIEVFNNQGQLVAVEAVNANGHVNLNGISAGIYFVRVITTEGTVTKKLIIK